MLKVFREWYCTSALGICRGAANGAEEWNVKRKLQGKDSVQCRTDFAN